MASSNSNGFDSGLAKDFDTKLELNIETYEEEGQKDETCIDESPETKNKSSITNIMVEQNKKT